MPKIKVYRRSEFANAARVFNVYIDGKKVGVVEDGLTKEFDVADGDHTLSIKIDWCGSPTVPISLRGSESRTFETGAFKNGSLLLPIFAAIVISHFMAKYFFHIQWILALSIPLFIPVVYYLTKGRNQYLTLTEINSR